MEKACVGASSEGRSDTCSGSESDLTSTSNFEIGVIACFAYANCSIEGSNGAGFSKTNSNQPSKEGNVTRKKKPMRSLRNFNLVHLQRLVAYIIF